MGQCLDIFSRIRNNNIRTPEIPEGAANVITSTPINNQTYTVSSDPNETGLSNSNYVTALMMSPITDSSPEQTLTQDMFKNTSDSGTENAE